MNPVTAYVNDLRSMYGSGVATEHSYRSSLENLLTSFDESVQVINEPRHLDFGAPDLVLQLAGQPIGYVECKDVRVALDAAENSEQLIRYRKACDNLILTNYREFRWYRGGDLDRQPVTIAQLDARRLRGQTRYYSELRSLLQRFLHANPIEITTPDSLAQAMADLTQEIAYQIRSVLDAGGENKFLHRHKHDLEQGLLPQLDSAEFADMYAQTLAYALFAARIQHEGPTGSFTLERAFFNMPSANPFLKREFQQIILDLEHEVKWAVNQHISHLSHTAVDEVMAGFRRSERRRDTIVHFYEDFLAAHDPVMREQRGVYFTPPPVVGYIVRSVDALLRSHFGRQDGLASDNVHILDPAVGTGSFLLRVIEQIYDTKRSQRGIWPDFLRNNLLPRLHGFELLMAPYTLAHMRLGMYLDEETGYRLGEDERLGIYLSNTLDDPDKQRKEGADAHIIEEANAAAAVKQDKPIMVVLGNPPYSGHSANKGKWIQERIQSYYRVDGVRLNERNPKWLQDDYVKFIRFGQWRIKQNGEGVLAFITNHAWLDNPTFRGMRQSLLNSFSEIYVLDLHGNSKKKETTPEGNRDDNVFDIQQGVSIAFFIRYKNHSGPARVFHSDCWGLRRDKYSWLNAHHVEDTDWQEIFPQSPSYFFVPFDYEGWREYEQGWKVTDIFPVNSVGIVTSRDRFVLDFDYDALRKRIIDFRDSGQSDDDIGHQYNLRDTRDWKLTDSRKIVSNDQDWESHFDCCLYRPFDTRHIYYHPDVIEFSRPSVMRHMSHKNLEQMSGGGGVFADSSPSVRSPKIPSTTSSSATPSSRAASHSATRGSGSSSRSTSTPRHESGHDDVKEPGAEAGVGSDNLHPNDSDPSLAVGQGSELPLPALPLRRSANLGLTVGRAGQVIDAGEWNIVLCTDAIADFNLFRRGGQVLFPLYLYA